MMEAYQYYFLVKKVNGKSRIFTLTMVDGHGDLLSHKEKFVDPNISDKPIIFEVFTAQKDESDALEIMENLVKPSTEYLAKQSVKKVVKKAFGLGAAGKAKKMIFTIPYYTSEIQRKAYF